MSARPRRLAPSVVSASHYSSGRKRSGRNRFAHAGAFHAEELLPIVSMKEAVVVKGVWGVSPDLVAVLPGETGRVKGRGGQG
jgi:hypothetical protein